MNPKVHWHWYLLATLCILILDASKIASQKCTYEDYHYWTGRAQLDYNEKNYKEAAKHYRKAFETNLFPMGTDLANALKTAAQIKDTLWAEALAIQLAKGGITLSYFNPFKDMAWYPAFTREYGNYEEGYRLDFDIELKEKFIGLVKEDSMFNAQYHSFIQGEIQWSLDDLINGAYKIRNGLLDLSKQYGFPCESKMGYYLADGNVRNFPINVLFIHIYQRGELLYLDKLSQMVCDGRLKPVDQALINGFRGYGNSTGIEQEMKIRYEKRKIKK